MSATPLTEPSLGLAKPNDARGKTGPGARPSLGLARVASSALPWIAPVGLLLIWQLVALTKFVSPQLLVPPAVVVATFIELCRSGELVEHLQSSLGRLGIGFTSGAVLGLGFGVAMGTSRRFEAYVAPLFQVARQLPTIALIPAFILLFGVEEMFKILLVAKACFFPVALAALDGTKNISRKYLEVAALYRVPRVQAWRLLILPAALPPIVAGVRISLGRAWMVLVAAELMAADTGLGQMMEMGRQLFRMDVVVVGVFVTGAIGLMLDVGVRLLEKHLVRWRPQAA